MSRVAKVPIAVPAGADVKIDGDQVTVKGPKGTLDLTVHPDVVVAKQGSEVHVKPQKESKAAWAMAGTMRSLINNMVVGVSAGFEKKLQLVGVGYRAQVKGKVINLSLGFSHPVEYSAPEGVTIETPSQTDIVVSGSDKQKVGQVAAELRAFRPPEPYKGKGVRYLDEHIRRKEAKKK